MRDGRGGIEAQEVTALVQELAPQELKHYELALINTEGVFILAEPATWQEVHEPRSRSLLRLVNEEQSVTCFQAILLIAF